MAPAPLCSANEAPWDELLEALGDADDAEIDAIFDLVPPPEKLQFR